MNLTALKSKVEKYIQVKKNTFDYRDQWNNETRDLIKTTLQKVIDDTDLDAEIEIKDSVENLEVIIMNLGRMKSGIREKLDGDESRSVVRNNGMLVYQQLFNGKIVVLIVQPFLEGYGEPQQPKSLEIVRPSELNEGFIIRHVEEFLKDLVAWEDYDDDQPVGKHPIGFSTNFAPEEEV
jgi:hypothetical protein